MLESSIGIPTRVEGYIRPLWCPLNNITALIPSNDEKSSINNLIEFEHGKFSAGIWIDVRRY